MTKSYAQLQKQIQALQTQADALRKKEIHGVVGRIREAIDAYGLTAADLGFEVAAKGKNAKPAKSASKPKGKKAKGATVVRFRDELGHTWGGRGPRPQWLRDALAAGKSLADFAV